MRGLTTCSEFLVPSSMNPPPPSQPETRNSKLETVVIRNIVQEAPDAWTLSFDATFAYKPGQSVQILFSGDTKKRYYSISSSPTEKGRLAVTIKIPADHVLAPLLKGLKVGNTVQLEGPFGSFGLPPDLTGVFCFIAGGGGVTPFRSMIKYLVDTRACVDMWLFHSSRTTADLIFSTEFSGWMVTQPSFHYITTLTRSPNVSDGIMKGRISEALLRKHVRERDAHFFLSGPSTFVGDMEGLLKGPLAVPVNHIRREQW